MSFVRDNMAPLMFAGMVVFMLIGYPAAFALAALGTWWVLRKTLRLLPLRQDRSSGESLVD